MQNLKIGVPSQAANYSHVTTACIRALAIIEIKFKNW